MATERLFEKLKAGEDTLTREEVQKRKYELWLATYAHEFESKRSLQTLDTDEVATRFRPKEREYELSEYEEEKVELLVSRRKLKVAPEINTQIESLQRDVVELQTRANFYFSEQAKHLQALAHQATRQEIEQRSLVQQVAELVQKAAPWSWASRKPAPGIILFMVAIVAIPLTVYGWVENIWPLGLAGFGMTLLLVQDLALFWRKRHRSPSNQ